MPLVQAKMLVRAPLERVFAYATDPVNLRRWMHLVADVVDVTGWPAPGATFRYACRFLGWSGQGEGILLQYEPGRRVQVAASNDLGVLEGELELTRRGAGCRVTLTSNYTPGPRLVEAGLEPLELQQLLYHNVELALRTLRALSERGIDFAPVRSQLRLPIGVS